MQVGTPLDQPRSVHRARKRLFVGLISVSCLVICVFLALLWVVPYIGLDNIHPAAKWVLGALILGLIGLVCVAYWALFLNIVTKKPCPARNGPGG